MHACLLFWLLLSACLKTQQPAAAGTDRHLSNTKLLIIEKTDSRVAQPGITEAKQRTCFLIINHLKTVMFICVWSWFSLHFSKLQVSELKAWYTRVQGIQGLMKWYHYFLNVMYFLLKQCSKGSSSGWANGLLVMERKAVWFDGTGKEAG